MPFSLRSFGPSEKQRERRYRVSAPWQKLKDFTKHDNFQTMLSEKETAFKSKQPIVRLSKIANAENVPKKRRAYLKTSKYDNPGLYSFANKEARK